MGIFAGVFEGGVNSAERDPNGWGCLQGSLKGEAIRPANRANQ